MPVTLNPSSKAIECWGKQDQLTGKYVHAASERQLLSSTTSNDGEFYGAGVAPVSSGARGIVQSSFRDLDRNSTVFAAKNGFVHGCIEAYNQHHCLVIRPEDVWFAILTQLSAYINANADDLRSLFVGHSGQKELHIEAELAGLDHGAMAYQMTKLMTNTMKEPSLRDWVLPAFSTTEKTDQTVASIIFMGTMQKYFVYSWGTRCGIPQVTLLGEIEDWIEIAERCATKLSTGEFGPGAEQWYRVLKPVLAGFIETFRNPSGSAAKRFWKAICDKHSPNGSGSITYSGWITAFCYWDEKGHCLHEPGWGAGGVRLSRGEIPMGFTKVPVTLFNSGKKIRAEMMAGSVGLRIKRSSGDDSDTSSDGGKVGRQRWEGFDTIQPESGWFMYFV